jgi:hypothetical protein
MMSTSEAIEIPKIEGVVLELSPPDTLRIKGTITRKEPSADLSGFFKAVHRDAISRRLAEVCVDVSELTFVNSSSIRLFIDWAVWVKSEPTHGYVLKFRTSRLITWQTTAFSALTSLMKEVVRVERV